MPAVPSSFQRIGAKIRSPGDVAAPLGEENRGFLLEYSARCGSHRLIRTQAEGIDELSLSASITERAQHRPARAQFALCHQVSFVVPLSLTLRPFLQNRRFCARGPPPTSSVSRPEQNALLFFAAVSAVEGSIIPKLMCSKVGILAHHLERFAGRFRV